MIEINLVPQEFRKKKKKSLMPGGFNIPLEVVIGVGGGLFFLLILVHIFLFMFNLKKLAEHKALKMNWEEILPSKNRVDAVLQEMRGFQNELKSIEGATKGNGIVWAKKLNIISNSLPRGVWLKKIELTDEILFIQGSAISRQNNEMLGVHSFTSNLKKDSDFLKNLGELELGSIQSSTVQSTEVADFLITTKLK